jgi:hypothetical protein
MKPSLLCLVLSLSINFTAYSAVPDVWSLRTSPNSSDLHGIGYGRGAFVSVGSHGTILRSHDGVIWYQRSPEFTEATLLCVDEASLLLGGGGPTNAVILHSADGFTWRDVSPKIAVDRVFDIVFGNQLSVAVGHSPRRQFTYVLTSPDAFQFNIVGRPAPTTNALMAITYANNLFVAVGNLGTIVTSPNGTNWTLRSSGTQRALRAVVFHQSRFLAGGDAGTVLQSSDGINWTPSAPTSFEVHGMASGNGVVIAVGSRDGGGRLHGSVDGLGWPGTSRQFPQPLNSITYGPDSFVAVGNQGFIIQSAGLTNEWTKATSGDWQEPFWSLGELPSTNHALIAFRNPGFKALAIQSSTTANHRDSLTIKNLLVDAPPASANLLLLNYAGLNVPLNVLHDFAIGTNGALLSYYSRLQASNLQVNGTATFAEASTAAIADNLQVGESPVWTNGAFGHLEISNAVVSTTYFDVPNGRVDHYAGTNIITGSLALSSGRGGRFSHYLLSGGVLMSRWVDIGYLGHAFFHQSGGIHTNGGMDIFIRHESPGETSGGQYTLSGGMLHSANRLELRGGAFVQTGGTNYADILAMASGGSYTLYGGVLNCSNVSVGPYGGLIPPDALSVFFQDGGVHTVLNQGILAITRYGLYRLNSGTLNVWSIHIEHRGELVLSGGTIAGNGGVLMQASTLRATGIHQLGRLQLQRGFQAGESTIDLSPNSTVLRFLDNRFVTWSSNVVLTILNWSGSLSGGGADQLIFGTNSMGLRPDQLAKTQFVNPAGLPPGRYLARILASGEVVPGDSASLAFMRSTNGMVLNWSDNFELLTATNLAGPFMPVTGATSPYTNSFTGPQRFFYLRERSQ